MGRWTPVSATICGASLNREVPSGATRLNAAPLNVDRHRGGVTVLFALNWLVLNGVLLNVLTGLTAPVVPENAVPGAGPSHAPRMLDPRRNGIDRVTGRRGDGNTTGFPDSPTAPLKADVLNAGTLNADPTAMLFALSDQEIGIAY
jgi:hypothetical protein